jgi:hypothetical protein
MKMEMGSLPEKHVRPVFDARQKAWKVDDPRVTQKRNGTIVFDAGEREGRIWIPVDGIVDRMFIELHGKPEVCRVLPGARPGEYPYSFYLRAENAMLEGNTPPKMVIEDD